MIVGSYSPKVVGEKYFGPIMNSRIQQWIDMPYIVLEQVTEEIYEAYLLEEYEMELDSVFRGAYYYRISVD